MNVYYQSLVRLYNSGRATTFMIAAATTKGWITQEQYTEITGEAY